MSEFFFNLHSPVLLLVLMIVCMLALLLYVLLKHYLIRCPLFCQLNLKNDFNWNQRSVLFLVQGCVLVCCYEMKHNARTFVTCTLYTMYRSGSTDVQNDLTCFCTYTNASFICMHVLHIHLIDFFALKKLVITTVLV